MSLLEPVSSRNIELSQEAKEAIFASTGRTVNTFDQLVKLLSDALAAPGQVQALASRLDNLTAEDLPSKAGTYGLRSGAVEVSRIPHRKAALTRSGNSLTYDFGAILDQVPADMAVVGSTLVVTGPGGKGRVADSGNAGVVDIPGAGSSARLEVNIQTTKGIISLSKTVLVPEDDGTTEVNLGVVDHTEVMSDMKVSEHLGVLSAKVAALAQKVEG